VIGGADGAGLTELAASGRTRTPDGGAPFDEPEQELRFLTLVGAS
jgi:hypothetical protein